MGDGGVHTQQQLDQAASILVPVAFKLLPVEKVEEKCFSGTN